MMPVYESVCTSVSCPLEGVTVEHYYRHCGDPLCRCKHCDGETEMRASRFASPLMGSLRKYTDLKREGAEMEGFWAYRRARNPDTGEVDSTKPGEPVWLDSMAAIRKFNRSEGLADPSEVPTNCTVSADGKEMQSTGMPGQWTAGGFDPRQLVPARVWEMDTKLTSLHGKNPEPQASGPPCTAEVVDAGLMEQFAATAAQG